jgi:ABC-2 type transport system permease protein
LRSTLIITQRELLSYFRSPVGYVVAVIFLAFSGYVFGFHFLAPGEEASLRGLFARPIPLLMLLVIPMITKRLVSEEFRSGTIESLLTAPISDAAVILGKFLGALGFYLCLLLATSPYVAAVARHGGPDWGAMASGYAGLVLLGALYIAVGLFFSACTSSQIVAVIASFSLLAVLTLLAGSLAQHVGPKLRLVLLHLSIDHHFIQFVHGSPSLGSLVFFVTTTALMLFLAVKVLESRRWR